MRSTFHSDNGAACYRCSGTIYTYHCDDAVSLVDTVCISCNARDVFTTSATPSTPPEASAAHRAAKGHLFGGTIRSALTHAATRYDVRQSKGKRYNVYALAQYLARI